MLASTSPLVVVSDWLLSCHHLARRGHSKGLGHELLPGDLAHITGNLEKAMYRMPCPQTAGIKRVINAPVTFSPDLDPLLVRFPALAPKTRPGPALRVVI
ncbi:MAG: hypothetical protein EOS76_16565 [Mesorhizobium sp.]|uniref:hypothetical protein n=1 Tax=Mesorhizobium sp. TaxID=1871066 RepID=UPI000FE4BF83|nr:hypothetical protein [Mesorhizobium sp.]RWE18377.1 MAG: hypothetical protein EOS76_16565 [Mesorhizobium sp.]